MKKINFKRGSGESLSLCAFAVFICFLFVIFLSFIQFSSSANELTKITETSARAAALCGSIEDAKEQATRVAKAGISSSCISNISILIEPATDEEEWISGNYFYVTVYGHVQTIEPYFTTKNYGKKTLICVEMRAPEKLHGNSTAEQAFHYFVEHGFSKAAAAGIIGNFAQEVGGTTIAGIDHTSNEGGAAGIAQWTPASKLYRAAQASGRDWTDLSFQLEHLIQDIPQNWYGSASSQTRQYISAGLCEDNITFTEFMNMTDPEKAAIVFCAYFEQCHLRNSNVAPGFSCNGGLTRTENAKLAYEMFR